MMLETTCTFAALETRTYAAPDGTRYKVELIADPDSESPRGDSNGAVLLTFDNGWESPDGTPAATLPAAIGNVLERAAHAYRGGDRVEVGKFARWARTYAPSDILFIGGLYRQQDGSLSLDSRPRDDETADGVAIVTADGWREMVGDCYLTLPYLHTGPLTPADMARQEVETYRQWLAGEVYGYVIEEVITCDLGQDHAGELIESVWGFYGDPDEVLSEAIASLPVGTEMVGADRV